MQQIIYTRRIPRQHENREVIPLYKAGERNVFSNYRPISLLSQFSKILEKLFNERLDKCIDKCNVLNNSQYGFRNKRVNYALINLVEEISSSLDAKKFSIGVFIDIKKAFDTVNHALLIDKLEFYGVRGSCIKPEITLCLLAFNIFLLGMKANC